MQRQVFYPNPNHPKQGTCPVTRINNLVFVSGQLSSDSEGNIIGEKDINIQSEKVFNNLQDLLKTAGAKLTDVAKITAYLVNADDYSNYTRVRHAFFPKNPPASATVIVKELIDPKFLVEVEAIAIVE